MNYREESEDTMFNELFLAAFDLRNLRIEKQNLENHIKNVVTKNWNRDFWEPSIKTEELKKSFNEHIHSRIKLKQLEIEVNNAWDHYEKLRNEYININLNKTDMTKLEIDKMFQI